MERADLPASLRKVLEKAIREVRIAAEAGASDAIRRLAVAAASPPSHLDKVAKDLRVLLRAHARSLGDARRSDDTHEVGQLTEEVAYAHWHRLLFARFLLERRLLREPESGGEVSLDDCRELARAHGLPDAWSAAERFAASMLPGVFRPDDPALAVTFAPEHAAALQRIVQSIDPATFQADDSLGWTYQFWRAAEKDAINKSGVKIGANELPAVTQLFTEPYMVRFLLHNTLGAWWAGKILAANPSLAVTATNEYALRSACAPPGYSFNMLRFIREGENGPWRPAAGTFSGWPREAKAITVLDPCCGSGHFLTEALAILATLRRAEEGLPQADAVAAALRDNLHGLEIDERCVQIAAFAVALTAWRIGGWQILPVPHIAWVGAPPPMPKKEFVSLAEGRPELEYALAALHDLFVQAPLLGSLLEPSGSDLFEAEKMREIEQLLPPLIERARLAEPERAEGAIAARGMADAAALLHRRYTLQVTNVPYLGANKQVKEMAEFVRRHYEAAKADLATAILSRMCSLIETGGSLAAVTPQNWLYLGRYKDFRLEILNSFSLNMVAALGARAFETISGEVVNTLLICWTNNSLKGQNTFASIDANDGENSIEKSDLMQTALVRVFSQASQITNPESRISTAGEVAGDLLSSYATALSGSSAGDAPRYLRKFWEVFDLANVWRFHQSTVSKTVNFAGKDEIIFWENERGEMYKVAQSVKHLNHAAQNWLRGKPNWGKGGVCISQMGDLSPTIYTGEIYDCNACGVVPNDPALLPALWAFAVSGEWSKEVRKFDKSLKVTPKNLLKIPFDRAHWISVAKLKYEAGLPEPYSDDPSQWLFHGHPAKAETGTALHVALARLCGYRWPAEADPKMRLAREARAWIAEGAKLPEADSDGLLCLPAVAGKRALADRLRSFLAAAFGRDWSNTTERRLLTETDDRFENKPSRDASLEGWLRDRAFHQHCALFHNRPFLWHIWDGQKDGFAAIVHYHRLNRANLEKLTFSLLGDWIGRMKAADDARRVEAAMILQPSLQTILEGEKPYDIFVRWKPPAKQPLGWEPDLDDGVRINIRPFAEAEVLREVPNIKWTKDRGTDVKSAPWYDVFKGQRINDRHTTLAEKRRARGLK
jgi:hypothetical protein